MLQPVAHVSPGALARGQRHLVQDLAWASFSGSFAGGVILTAFALTLGATPIQIGLLAAIPFITQAAQLPATLLIERTRQRRKLSVLSITMARMLVLGMALLPFLPWQDRRLALLMGLQAVIAALVAMGGCAVNSWLHQLIPHRELGSFFSRRLVAGTALACIGTLAAGWLVDHAVGGSRMNAYAVCFCIATATGFISSWHLARAPEPQMVDTGPAEGLARRMLQPFLDRNFRRLLVFLASWTIAANLAAPFLTVYLIEQRGYPIGTVTSLWVASQVANALTLFAWGRLSDRLSNKGVLAVALPAWFASVLALVFVDALDSAAWQLAALFAVHMVMGIAGGGIGLATGNLGLKLAPHGQGTVHLAAIGMATAVAGGIAPPLAGALAQWFRARELAAVVRWSSPGGSTEASLVTFAHWEFLFAISAALGLYVMHALSRIDEGREVSERHVAQAFALEAWRSLNALSSTALGALFPFERLSERRKWWKGRETRRSQA